MNPNTHQHFPNPPPHQMNRPPPTMSIVPDNDALNQQRKSWIHNNQGSTDLSHDDIDLAEGVHGIPPLQSNFRSPPQNNRGGFPGRNLGNFRGQNRGGAVRGGMNNNNNSNNNNSPYNNNFKGSRGRGGGPPRGFRGNFRGQW